MSKFNPVGRRAGQQGAVLISGLIFLVVLTMFVLALVRGGSLEERLARNSRDQQIAREAAEAVLRDAESTIFAAAPFDPFDRDAFASNCPSGYCFNPSAAYSVEKVDWSPSGVTRSFAVPATSKLPGLTVQPRYLVELIKLPIKTSPNLPCTPGIARVTARAEGNGGAIAIIQSSVRFRVFSNLCE